MQWHSEVKSLSHVRLFVTPWTVACHALRPWDFPGKNTVAYYSAIKTEIMLPYNNMD